MSKHADPGSTSVHAFEVAQRLVSARLSGRALDGFPGEIPADLSGGYACQEAAISLWPDTIAGWKVGAIGDSLISKYGQDRLVGPIFRKSVRFARGDEPVEFSVIKGGFAAVEAEYVFVIGRDAPPDKIEWSRDEVVSMVEGVRVGVETAGSPMLAINDLGPGAIVSDFGNNAGLILGDFMAEWLNRPVRTWRSTAYIDGKIVGSGDAGAIRGEPLEALRFLLGHSARRGRPLKAGMLASTGAVTGIHEISPGQTARVDFGDDGRITCRAVLGGQVAAADSLPPVTG
jgi:2-keto-4-pentenoate hydratase